MERTSYCRRLRGPLSYFTAATPCVQKDLREKMAGVAKKASDVGEANPMLSDLFTGLTGDCQHGDSSAGYSLPRLHRAL